MNFHGEKRSNETHASPTNPESKLYRKSRNHEAKLSYSGDVLMQDRHGLIVDLRVEPATGYAERDAALAMLDKSVPNQEAATLGADAGYNTSDFVATCRDAPHIAQTRDDRRRSAVDSRTTRHAGYRVSQRLRKRVEEIFGWAKTVACFRKTRFRGQARTQLAAHLVAVAYNLLRMSKADARVGRPLTPTLSPGWRLIRCISPSEGRTTTAYARGDEPKGDRVRATRSASGEACPQRGSAGDEIGLRPPRELLVRRRAPISRPTSRPTCLTQFTAR